MFALFLHILANYKVLACIGLSINIVIIFLEYGTLNGISKFIVLLFIDIISIAKWVEFLFAIFFL